jgi:carboxypeptidase Q
MPFKKIGIVIAIHCLFSMGSKAQTTAYKKDSLVLASMQNFILEKSVCYSDLRILCKSIGNRISGSPAAAKAVEWGIKTLKAAGADKVYTQPVMVPHWIRGKEEFAVTLNNGKKMKIPALGIGNSIGTDGKTISAEIIIVKSKEELEALGEEKVKGKIVFFNYVWNQHCANPFDEYGNAVYYRWAGPSIASKYGAIASVIRSAGSAYDANPHTGSMRYDSAYPKVPAMAISYLHANELEKLIADNTIKSASMLSTSKFGKDELSYNVIGELVGTESPEKIITVGGHLDSWDVGEGAHDDGAGVVQSIEVIRAFKQAGVQPKQTVRCVLFMNEENGLKGGQEYARLAKENKETHTVAIETDAGGFSPRGFSMNAEKEVRQKIKSWDKYFMPIGVYNFEEEGGGADIGPLHKSMNTPVLELSPDPQRYFDLHHTQADVFEAVHRRELAMGALSMAMMVYLIDTYGL